MAPIRAVARAAVVTLEHQPVMAEDFGALPHSPQVACLAGVRQSAAVILILGERYGAKQPSGRSATHEEYLEARDRCSLLVFVQEGVSPEPEQATFIKEVESWKTGFMRQGFIDSNDLQAKIIRALHRIDVTAAGAPFDAQELLARAAAAFPESDRGYHHGPVLSISVAGGPSQTILRPAEMDQAALAEKLEQMALYGTHRIFERGAATESQIEEAKLVLKQGDRSGRNLILDAQGGVLIQQPLSADREDRMSSVILVETVKERMVSALRYSLWLLDEMDPTQRLSHLVVGAFISGGMTMRTRAEHQASPNSYSMSSFGRNERSPVYLSPPHMLRPALAQRLEPIVEDLTVLLRRQFDQR